MSPRIAAIHRAVEHSEKCRATHIESAAVKERFEGKTIWEGVVETFQLEAHPTAKRAYAWMRPGDGKSEPEYTIVLGVPPVNSAQDAVKVAVVGATKKLIRLAEELRR